MNQQVGIASDAGAMMAQMPAGVFREVVRVWEPAPKKLSFKESLTAGAFLVFYLAAYLAAGFAGVSFIEWAWMRVFG